ncbi:MAG TPA: hypothetical protein VH025_01740 [Solirubrobacteraceae bacterium]|jgi:hypothetical protein|nr:hypothetical protein [Solirubrobacteraceae bacterium]
MDASLTGGRSRLVLFAAALLFVAMLYALGGSAPLAHADGPGAGSPWTVSVGDSYISGEAGRWAGSTDESSSWVDALGSSAYYDNASGTGETIAKCHRSKSAEVYIGGGVSGMNLACSGAKTSTFSEGETFKPGLDFYNSGGKEGQALMLQHFASSHNVKLVAVSIGGNNFNFAGIVQDCVEDFLFSPSWWPNYCDDDSSVTSNFTSGNVAKVKGEITTAIKNIGQAMTNAGYSASQYTILVQDYPSPIPLGSGFRYSQSGYTRQSTGGCGFWNADANYADEKMLPTIDSTVFGAATATGLGNVKTMELSSAFNGRRLCEKGVGLLEEEGLTSWKQAGAVDRSEWVNEIRTVSTVFGPYQIQESIHPNYWGQLALRNCLTQAYNGGAPKSGTCTIAATGLNSAGEPNMSLR